MAGLHPRRALLDRHAGGLRLLLNGVNERPHVFRGLGGHVGGLPNWLATAAKRTPPAPAASMVAFRARMSVCEARLPEVSPRLEAMGSARRVLLMGSPAAR